MKKNISAMSAFLFIFMLASMFLGNIRNVEAKMPAPTLDTCDTAPCTGGPWQYRSITIYIDSNCYVDVSYKVRKCPGKPCEIYIEKAVVNQFGSGGPGGVNCASISSMTPDDILKDIEMSIVAKVTWLYPCDYNQEYFEVIKPMCWKQGWVYCEDEEQWQVLPCDDTPCCRRYYFSDKDIIPPVVTEWQPPSHPPYQCEPSSGCYDACQ